jgi:putative oxidoreductase
MSYGLLLLRVVVGAIFAAHGAQKLFGWWGGPGRAGTRGWIGSMGFRPDWLFALLVSLQEFGGGLLLAVGFLTPLGSLAVVAAMVVAVALVHWQKGFFAGNGGYEYNLSLVAAAVALAATGPGRFSVDRALHWDDNLTGVRWAIGVVVIAVVGGLLAMASRKKEAVPGT